MEEKKSTTLEFYLFSMLVVAVVGIFFYWLFADQVGEKGRYIRCMESTEGQYEEYCRKL